MLLVQTEVSPHSWPVAQSPPLSQPSARQYETPEQVTPVEPTGQGGGQTGIAHATRTAAENMARMPSRGALRIFILHGTSIARQRPQVLQVPTTYSIQKGRDFRLRRCT